MYHLRLVKGSESYNFLKFTANFYFLLFQESKDKPTATADMIEALKVQLDIKGAEEVVQLNFDLPVLEHLSKLIDQLAKLNLEGDECYNSVALETEKLTGIQLWHRYLSSADQYFKDLKSFMHEDEWKIIAGSLSADTKIDVSN